MMNTNEGKHDNIKQRKIENSFKTFRWNKEWVRPYESIYSILRNFCKVNVFQGSYAMKVLDVKGSSTELPIPKIMMFSKSIQNRSNYDILYDALLPDWYREQISPITSLDVSVFSDVVKPMISYCPECAKEGYHSFLFQFYHVKECTFHHIPLIETLWHYTPQDSITNFKSEKYTDVKNDILPCERQLANLYYQSGFCSNLRYVIPVSSIDNSKHGLFSHMHQIFCNENGASHSVHISKSKLNLEELKQQFTEWFDSQNIPTNFCHPEHIWKIHTSTMVMFLDENSTIAYLEYLLYYLFYSFMKEYDLSSEKSFARIESVYDSVRVLYPEEVFELKISYLWAIISCSNPFYSLNYKWIVHPGSPYTQNTRNIYNGIHLSNLNGYNLKYRKYIPETDGIILMMYILSDLFQSMWNQLLSIVEKEGKISAFNGWKLLHVPEYYICINAGEDFYTVLRYENMPY